MYTNTCPQCGELSVLTCKCMLRDSVCQNGHHWFYCAQHGIKIQGEADHSGDTLKCRCNKQDQPHVLSEPDI